MSKLSHIVLLCGGVTACTTPIGTKDKAYDSGTDGSTEAVVFGGISMEPGSLDFGSVAMGSSGPGTVTLTNTLSTETKVSNAFIDGSEFDFEAALDLPITLGPDETFLIELVYEPTLLETQSGLLSVGVAGEVGYGEIELVGTGSDASTSPTDDSGSPPTGAGILSTTPSSLVFGSVAVSDTSWRTMELSNVGTEEVLITSIITSNLAFDVEPDFSIPKSISPGGTETMQVSFLPTEMREYNAVLDIDANTADGGLLVTLSGQGAESSCEICAPVLNVSSSSGGSSTLDLLPPWTFGCTANGSLTLSNAGDMPLDISNVTLSNDLLSTCGTFSHSWGGPVTLAPAESTIVAVDYVATDTCIELSSPDFDQNMIHILSNDTSVSDYAVELTATTLFCE
ncbi:MAG: choice-of-anchor D domain-containing protein [Myxococcota bacterium]